MATAPQQKRARTLQSSCHLCDLGTDVVCLCLSYFCFRELYTKRTVSTQFQTYCNRTLKQKRNLPLQVSMRSSRYAWSDQQRSNFLQSLQKHSPNLKTASFAFPVLKEILLTFKKLETLQTNCGFYRDGGGVFKVFGGDVFKVFPDLPNLTDISFVANSHVDLNLFKNLHLKRLMIAGLACASFENVVDMLQQQTSLEKLRVGGSAQMEETGVTDILPAVGCLPGMKDIFLNCKSSDFYLITIVKYLPNLEVLRHSNMRRSTVTNSGLAVISALKSLRVLDISDSNISSLCALRHVTFQHLKYFSAERCKLIGDNSLKMLPEIMPNVEVLELLFMCWTMTGFGYLMDLKSLRILSVDGTENLDFYNFDSARGGNVFGKLQAFSALLCDHNDDVKHVLRRFMPRAERIDITGRDGRWENELGSDIV